MNGSPPLFFVPLGVLFSLVWSSAFIAGAVAVPELGPFPTLVLRFVLSAIALLPWCLRDNRILEKRLVGTGLLLGALNNGVYLGLTFYALGYISPALVVVCVSCAPFIALGLAALMGIERLNWRKGLGTVIGVAGVVVITGINLGWNDIFGIGLALAGTVSFALATVLFRGKSTGMPLMALNFWQSVSGAVVLLPFALLTAGVISGLSPAALAAVLYLTIGVTMGGMLLWLALIRMGGVARASAFHLLNPVFGVLLSHAVFQTGIELRTLAGAAIVGVGLYLCLGGKAGPASRIE
ncbi:DMT family transporter [Pelagibacterium limicola]|uniref:DMT family transporter n=1 Tax=Pelagibacterium limicola TaxID=2791022 RepID=UPI0018AF60DC|nr:DMT family transporter [Pelagibacterium limicola]